MWGSGRAQHYSFVSSSDPTPATPAHSEASRATGAGEAGVRFRELAASFRAAFRAWEAAPAPWPDARFDELARLAFDLQFDANPPYRAYCRRRGVAPSSVRGWRDVTPVPTAAYRAVSLSLRGAGEPAAVFLTSGTTGGAERRGRHPVLDLELYRASLEAAFRWHVLEGEERGRIVSLVPPFEPARESSLSWMCDAVIDRFGDARSGSVVEAELDWVAAERLMERTVEDEVPVCILATTLAAHAWLDRLAARGVSWTLPAGSRFMDTGGTKGRATLERARVVEAIESRLAIPEWRVINELGMTELLSQRYSRPPGPVSAAEPEAGPEGGGASARSGSAGGEGEPLRLHGPPWLRSRALDPETLEERPEGEVGLLCHFDLANLGSVCAVLTEDLGSVRDGVVEWVGRATGAPPRGCSLAAAELLAAAAAST